METVRVPYSRWSAHFRFHANCCAATPISETFAGSLELYEHTYSSDLSFWHAVARIECHCLYHFWEATKKLTDPAQFSVNVRLSDGRQGMAWVLHPEYAIDAGPREDEPVLVGLLGALPLWGGHVDKESKQEAHLTIGTKQRVPATLQLFEHRFEEFSFWWAVATISGPRMGLGREPFVPVDVFLTDGRTGRARAADFRTEEDGVTLALVGETRLL
jgi:hypothetical protein